MSLFNQAHILWGRLAIALHWQGAGAPILDRAYTREVAGLRRRFKGYSLRPPFMRDRICPAIFCGWIEPARPGLIEAVGFYREMNP